MKLLLAISILIVTLGLAKQSTANTPDVSCSAHNANDTDCLQQSQEAHGAKNGAKTGHKDPSAEMNSLFPEKQPIAKLAIRPAIVELMAPKFLSKVSGSAKLQWKEAKGANAYHIQVATDPNFKWLVAEEHLLKTTSFEFSKSEAGKKYFWRVAAYNSENESSFTKSNFTSSVFISQ